MPSTLIRRGPLAATLLGALAFVGSASSTGRAATIEATSGQSQDIQAAVDQAQPGDEVVIPAGTFDYTGQVLVPDGIHLRGAGADSTVLVKQDDLSASQPMIEVDCASGEPFRFSGITLEGRGRHLQGADTTNQQTDVHDRGLFLAGRCVDFQIYASRFTMFTRAGVVVDGSSGTVPGHARGVVYDSEFIDNFIPGLGYGVEIYGNADWPALELGTAEVVFVEDNLFDRSRHAIAANNGARYVFRHNQITDNYYPWASIDAHGLSSWPRGTRSYEIYDNDLTFSAWSETAWAIGIRGGDGVVFGNTFDHQPADSFFMLTIDSYSDGAPYPLPDQTTDLWLWDNLDNGSPVDHVRLGWSSTMEQQLGPYLVEGRDYHFGQRAGYSPFAYPHPGRDDGGAGGGAAVGGAGSGASGGTGGSAGTGGSGGTPTGNPAADGSDDDGCGCRTRPKRNARWFWSLAALGFLATAGRRCRGTRRHSHLDGVSPEAFEAASYHRL